jgi:hypothetical protein
MVAVTGSVLQEPVQLAVALVSLQWSAPCNNQPLGPQSPLDVITPPLDFALSPLEVVWHGVPLGESVFGFIAPFSFATEAFAAAIFVANPSYCFCRLVSGAMFPWKALVSRCMAWMTIVFEVYDVLVLEKYCVAYPCCSCFHDIDLETAMVFHGCPDVEFGFGMGVPRSANVRFYM